MDSFSMLALMLVVGLLLAINPFNLSVFSVFLAGLIGKGHVKPKIYKTVFTYLITYWLVIASLSMLLVFALKQLPNETMQLLALVASGIIILGGMISLRKYFWHHKQQVPKLWHSALHRLTVKNHTMLSSIKLGLLASFVSLGSIGLQLLALVIIVVLLTPDTPQWMLLPSFCLILPLLLIYWQTLKGFRVSALLRWKNDSYAMLYLNLSLEQVALGWLILAILNGSIGALP